MGIKEPKQLSNLILPTVEVFCCYAREDQELMKSLRKHLMTLQNNKLITIWSDIDINAGDEWEKEIEMKLKHGPHKGGRYMSEYPTHPPLATNIWGRGGKSDM